MSVELDDHLLVFSHLLDLSEQHLAVSPVFDCRDSSWQPGQRSVCWVLVTTLHIDYTHPYFSLLINFDHVHMGIDAVKLRGFQS